MLLKNLDLEELVNKFSFSKIAKDVSSFEGKVNDLPDATKVIEEDSVNYLPDSEEKISAEDVKRKYVENIANVIKQVIFDKFKSDLQ